MRFKGIFGSFLFLICGCLVGLVFYIQSEAFGRLLSKVINDVVYKKTKTSIELEKIKFSFFPPGIEVKKIDLAKKLSETDSVEAQIGSLGFYINFYEIEENKISLGEVKIEDTYFNYKFAKTEDEPLPEKLDQNLINKIFDFSQIGPIRIDTLVFQNVLAIFNDSSIDVRRLKIIRYQNTFRVKSHLTNIRLEDAAPYVFDGVWTDIDISKKDLNIYNFRVHQDTHEAKINGFIKNYPLLKKASFEINGDIKADLASIKRIVDLPEMIKFDGGIIGSQFKANYNGELRGEYVLNISNLDSTIMQLEKVSLKGEMTVAGVVVNELQASNKKENIKIAKPFTLFNIENKKLLPNRINAQVENLTLNNSLRILGPSLQVLKGNLTGELNFELKGSDLYFYPVNGFKIADLALIVQTKKGDDFTIVHAKPITLTDSQFRVVNNEFQMESNLRMAKTQIRLVGKINKDRVDFKTNGGSINLEDLGNIALIDLKGEGPLALFVTGPLDDVEIRMKGPLQRFGVLGYKLGDAEQETIISLRDSIVDIIQLNSKYNKTELYGNGSVNYDNLDLNLDIRSPQTSFEELKEIIAPVLDPITFLPPDLNMKAKVDCKIYGKAGLEDLKIKTKVNFRDFEAYGETISHGSFLITLDKKILRFKDLKGYKERGAFIGDIKYDMRTSVFDLNMDWSNVSLQSINKLHKTSLSFEGILDGSLRGGGTSKDYEIKVRSNINETKAFNYTFKDSLLQLSFYPDRYKGNILLFNDEIKADFDINMKQTTLSEFDLKVNVPDMKPLLVGLLGAHLELEEFTASSIFQYKASFYPDLSVVNFNGFLEKMKFSHPNFQFDFKGKSPQFIVKNNKIEKWQIDHIQDDIQLKSEGYGTFGKQVTITHQSIVDSNLLEILFSEVLAAEGKLTHSFVIEGINDKYSFNLTAMAKGLDLSIDNIPVPLNNTDYRLEYSNSKLLVKEFKTHFQTGSVSAVGDIFFDNNDPDINLSFKIDRAEIPILAKSSINLSGEGIILGNNLPYNLSGEVKLHKTLIVNELSEFESKSSVSQIRYLPKDQESILGKLLTLNLIVQTEQPVRITNSLMDVSFKGELNLSGSAGRPHAEGHLYSPLNTSKVFFKNSEYAISQADINFSAKKDIANPDFDVQATTMISSYKITAKAAGDLERFSFDLSSDPALTQNSILSLIAFGYTDEIQNTLTSGDQQSLTRMGVGSFVFDRFKINDILKKQFGLQINLGTVLEQSQSSMISGRGGDSAGPTDIARTRSATQIEVKKRLDEALSLSVSSTMGGSIGQRQSMNLNYSINKTLQLEGVYQLKTNADGEEDIIDTSIGGDVKLRWTFK